MTDTQRQLLQAIITNPDEDSVRLEYADCIQEQGEEDRAEFIRVQVELAKANCVVVDMVKSLPKHVWQSEEYSNVNRLQQRERELWVLFKGDSWTAAPCLAGFDFRHLPGDPEQLRGRPHLKRCYYSRGFVLSLVLPAEDFLTHADQLVWHPDMKDVGRCSCRMYGRDGWVLNFKGKWETCETCKGAGRKHVCRPVPDTAQPIQKVALTDDPRDIPGWEDQFRSVLRAEDGKCIWRCRKFPGIEFQFPVYGISNANVPQINPEGGLIVDYESRIQEDIDGFDGW